MKLKLCALSLSLAALYACSGSDDPAPTPPVAEKPFTFKMIGFNDYHGNLESPGTFGTSTAVLAADRPPVGGAEFMAAHVARLKAQNPLNVVVGAGDLIGTTPLVSASFFDEPAIETLNRIGLEFSAVGNHEFDQGAAELQRLQNGGCKTVAGVQSANSCKGAAVGTPVPFEGAKFKWLSANVITTATGKPLLPAYGIKTFNNVKVAFIGMTLKATPSIVTPTGVAGLEFKDEVQTVNALIPELRAQGIESIVVLVHEGGFQSDTLGDIKGCVGNLAGSAIANIVKQFADAVAVVVSGHTHAAYNCKLPNNKGRNIAVTSSSAFGRVLTGMDVTKDPATKDLTAVTATNLLVVRNDATIPAHTTVSNIIRAYSGLVSPVANLVPGAVSTALPTTRDTACNMPAGSLIADAQLNATKASGFGQAVIALMNGGGVRAAFTFPSSAAGEGDGNVTYGGVFTAQPFGNSLVTMSLTAQDLKNASAAATRFMLPSAGFKYEWDGAKACDARISKVTLTTGGVTKTIVNAAGVVVNPTKTFRITVNNFMATGGDGYSTFLKGTNLLGGAQDVDALSAFLANYKAPAAAYNPSTVADDGGTARISRVGGTMFPGGTNPNP